jgi:uncharacterized membrane protein YkoI
MKKKALVGALLLGLVVSTVGYLGLKGKLFAVNPNPTQETQDENEVNEPNYVGSIKITDTQEMDEASENEMLSKYAKISKDEAEKIALGKIQGTIIKTSLENENGYVVYAVTIKDSNGKVVEIKVDAGDGKVLTIENDDANESQEENKNTNDTDSIQDETID